MSRKDNFMESESRSMVAKGWSGSGDWVQKNSREFGGGGDSGSVLKLNCSDDGTTL